MENLFVILIVGFAGIYVIRMFHKNFKGDGGCHCECSSSCDASTVCQKSPNESGHTDEKF